MSLNVKMFWVDEERGWLSDARECLTEKIGQELELELEVWDAIGEAMEKGQKIDSKWAESAVSDFKGYDLALIDYRLGGDTTGAHLARKLRDKKNFTEIIFYSADQEGAKLALLDAKLELSGIYLVGRGPNNLPDEFARECFPILEAIFQKVLDVTRMRGIVVSAMSALELKLAELVISHPEFQKITGKSIVSLAVRKQIARAKEIRAIRAKGLQAHKMLENKNHRKNIASWTIMLHYAEQILGEENTREFKEVFSKKLRNPRNELAHKVELPSEYDDTRFREIRRDIRQCGELLDKAFKK